MSENIYDTANQLATELSYTEQFKKLDDAFAAVKADETAYKLYSEFKQLQMSLQQKQMQGAEVTEEEANELQSLAAELGENEKMTVLMNAERELSNLINDLNETIVFPINQLYRANEEN